MSRARGRLAHGGVWTHWFRLSLAAHVPAPAVPGVAARRPTPPDVRARARPRGRRRCLVAGQSRVRRGRRRDPALALAVATTRSDSRTAKRVPRLAVTLGVAASLALLVSGRIESGGLAAGPAMSFKDPGSLFPVVPGPGRGYRQPRRLALGLAAAAAAFCATQSCSSCTSGWSAREPRQGWKMSRSWRARAGFGFQH